MSRPSCVQVLCSENSGSDKYLQIKITKIQPPLVTYVSFHEIECLVTRVIGGVASVASEDTRVFLSTVTMNLQIRILLLRDDLLINFKAVSERRNPSVEREGSVVRS